MYRYYFGMLMPFNIIKSVKKKLCFHKINAWKCNINESILELVLYLKAAYYISERYRNLFFISFWIFVFDTFYFEGDISDSKLFNIYKNYKCRVQEIFLYPEFFLVLRCFLKHFKCVYMYINACVYRAKIYFKIEKCV